MVLLLGCWRWHYYAIAEERDTLATSMFEDITISMIFASVIPLYSINRKEYFIRIEISMDWNIPGHLRYFLVTAISVKLLLLREYSDWMVVYGEIMFGDIAVADRWKSSW